jgi:hypothetical protein
MNQQNDATKPPISEAMITGVNHRQNDNANEVSAESHLLVHNTCNAEAELHELRQRVQTQQAEIKSLRQQLEVMMSYLSIKDMEAVESDADQQSDPVLPSQKDADVVFLVANHCGLKSFPGNTGLNGRNRVNKQLLPPFMLTKR